MNEAVLPTMEPTDEADEADEADEPTELVEPPARTGHGTPLAVVVVVLFAVGLITAGLVFATRDEVAKARTAPRPRLPVAGGLGASRDAISAETPFSGGAMDAPAYARTIEVPEPLADLGRVADGYRLASVTPSLVGGLGRALGIEGEVVAADGQYRLAQGDRQLLVDGGSGSFHLMTVIDDACSTKGGQKDCVVSSPFVGHAIAPDEQPMTAPDPATRPSAQAVAEHLAAVVGKTAGVPVVEPRGDGWGVRIPLLVAGKPALGWEIWLTVDPSGQVRDASGSLGRPEKLASYPLVGVEAGIERLRTGWTGPGGGVEILEAQPPEPVPVPAVDAPPSTGTTGATGVTNQGVCTADPGARCAPGVAPMPPRACKPRPDGRDICELPVPPEPTSPATPPPPPRPIVVTGVRLGLLLTGDGRGQFLVPAYVFQTRDDGELTVAAITDADAGTSGAGAGNPDTPVPDGPAPDRPTTTPASAPARP
jgi:hypothetical protein